MLGPIQRDIGNVDQVLKIRVGGRSGSFALVHRALMVGGTPQEWTIAVAPESGTGELAGLGGAMTITLAGGKHGYDFNYTLPGR